MKSTDLKTVVTETLISIGQSTLMLSLVMKLPSTQVVIIPENQWSLLKTPTVSLGTHNLSVSQMELLLKSMIFAIIKEKPKQLTPMSNASQLKDRHLLKNQERNLRKIPKKLLKKMLTLPSLLE